MGQQRLAASVAVFDPLSLQKGCGIPTERSRGIVKNSAGKIHLPRGRIPTAGAAKGSFGIQMVLRI